MQYIEEGKCVPAEGLEVLFWMCLENVQQRQTFASSHIIRFIEFSSLYTPKEIDQSCWWSRGFTANVGCKLLLLAKSSPPFASVDTVNTIFSKSLTRSCQVLINFESIIYVYTFQELVNCCMLNMKSEQHCFLKSSLVRKKQSIWIDPLR